MFSQGPLVDGRGAAFSRLASRVLEALNEAVEYRSKNGETRTAIAGRIGCNRSQLSRILNGSVPNLTLRTISDILWATNFDPKDFSADPIELVSPNCSSFDDVEKEYHETFPVRTKTVKFSSSNIAWKQTEIVSSTVEHSLL